MVGTLVGISGRHLGEVDMRNTVKATIPAILLAVGALIAAPTHASPSHSVLWGFQGGPSDGSAPDAALIYDSTTNTFYGTTNYGGVHNNGTVFQIVGGVETPLYSFDGTGTGDGAHPQAGLVLVGGFLYGTTRDGGAYGAGTFYRLKLSNHQETVRYSFGGVAGDGRNPLGTLIKVGGLFYGTTVQGGNLSGSNCSTNTGAWDSCGTIYSITPQGVEIPLYKFTGGSDGANPYAGLLRAGSSLYGTTSMGGGGGNCAPNIGCGTVFAEPLGGGSDQVLYSFVGGASDGALPYTGSLIKVGSWLYGTTFYGGSNDVGTVYREKLTGGPDELKHSFCGNTNCTDGEFPTGGLINVGNMLYGTTYSGGSAVNCSFIYTSCGTAFEMQLTGNSFQFTSFLGGADGGHPYSEIIQAGGPLYGTTEEGGGSGNCAYPPYIGCGTVYMFTP